MLTQSVSGLGRSWSRGLNEKNCPVTFYRQIERLKLVSERLRNVRIECNDFRPVLQHYDSKDTLFYCDPPYVKATRCDGIYRHEMEEWEHEELLRRLNEVKGMVMLSGYDCPLYRQYLDERGWVRYEYDVRVWMDNVREGRKMKREVLWLNRQAEVQRQKQLSLMDVV